MKDRFPAPKTIAIYRCSACGKPRQYGHNAPDTGYEPKLYCADCGGTTTHRFAKVMDGSHLREEQLRLLRQARRGWAAA